MAPSREDTSGQDQQSDFVLILFLVFKIFFFSLVPIGIVVYLWREVQSNSSFHSSRHPELVILLISCALSHRMTSSMKPFAVVCWNRDLHKFCP